MMNYAVSYARISPTCRDDTDESMAKSIRHQLDTHKAAALARGDVIIEEFIDQYVSGKSQEYMLSFQRMRDFIRASQGSDKPVKKVYIKTISRFGRNSDEMITTEIELKNLGVSLVSTEEGFDTSTPMGRMVMNILAHLAEAQRIRIVEDTERGRREKLLRIRAGSKERGFGRPKKEVDPKKVLDLKRAGYKVNNIASMLRVGRSKVFEVLKELKKQGSV